MVIGLFSHLPCAVNKRAMMHHRRSLAVGSLPDTGDGSYTSPGFRAVQMCLTLLLAVELFCVCDRPTSRNIRGTVCYSAACVQHLPDRLLAVLSNV